MEGCLDDKSKKVESSFLTNTFKKVCPFFISIGVTYEQFWEGDLEIPKMYYEAYKIKEEREQEIKEWNIWKNGVYNYEALCYVAPVLHAFSKKGTKPLPFPEEPHWINKNRELFKTEEQKQKEIENEKLKVQIWLKNLGRDMKNRFTK